MRLSIRFNASAFSAYIARVQSEIQSGALQESLLRSSDAYHGAMRNRFRSASGGDGTWEPLAKSTVAEHARVGDGPPAHALRLTGDLESSLARGEVDHVLEMTSTSIIEGTQDPKARFQHDGTGRIPARTIYVPADSDTLARMKAPLVAGLRSIVKVGQALDFSDAELSETFGIDII